MRILKYILVAVFAAVFLGFAFANREPVTVYFDPLGGSTLPPKEAPAYVVLLIAVAVGVIAGSLATWIGQGRSRRRARAAEAEADRLRYDLQAARAAAAAAPAQTVPLARQA